MAKTFEEIIGSIETTLPTRYAKKRSFDEIISEPIPVFKTNPRIRSFEEIIGDVETRGFFGAVVEDIAEKKIPFSPVGVFEKIDFKLSAKRLQDDRYDEPVSPLRMLAGAVGLPVGQPVRPGTDYTPGAAKQRDIIAVESYLKEFDERQNRSYTTMGRVGQITSEMPAFMIEFISTGALKKFGTAAGKKAASRMLGKYASTTAGKAAIATGGFAVGTAARAAGMPHRAANAILKRQVPQDIKISEDGDIEVIGPVESPMTSLWKGLADHWIEIASEEAGEVIAPFVSKYFSKMPLMGKLTGALKRGWLAKFPNKTASDFTKKILRPGGFHGVITEVGEEYLGDITRAITDVEHFGAGEDAGMLERIGAGVRQDNANLLPMLISFSIPGAIGKGANVIERRQAAVIQKEQKNIQEKYDTMMELAEEAAEAGETMSFENFEEQFDRYKFNVPGVDASFTPKWLLNRLLGIDVLLEDVTNAEMARKLEQQDINSWIDKLMPRLKKEKDLARLPDILPTEAEQKEKIKENEEKLLFKILTTGVQTEEQINATIQDQRMARLRREADLARGIKPKTEDLDLREHILQTKIDSKNPIHIMRDLLDTYEEAPEFLTKSEAKIFNEIRELTRYLRTRANMVRERMGKEPIPYLEGYITHWMDAAANKVIDRDVTIHSGYLYQLMQGLPKEIKNYTAEKRKIVDSMEKYFSKDLGRLLKVMTAYDLKDIYLSEPYQIAWEELQELRKKGLIPNSTFKQAEKFLLYDIRKHKAPMDKAFNKTVKKPVDLLNRLLPIKNIIDDPAGDIFGTLSNLQTMCGLGFRLRPINRNFPQRLLNLDLYRTVDYAKAQAVAFRLAKMPVVKHPITGADVPLIDLIREADWYKLALNKFAEIDSTVSGIAKSSLYLYGKSHIGNLFISNVEVSALTGYFDWLNMYNQSKSTKSKHFKNCIKQSKKLGTPASELLTQESDMMWNIREAVRRTQWEYFSISMPAFYRSQFNRAVLKFQSWWMNYFFNHCREMINQSVTGRNSLGRLLTSGGRLRAAKGLGTVVAIGKAAKTLVGIEMLKYLFFPLPGYLPPIPELIVGLIQFFGADNEKERKRAWSRVKYGLKFWIPFSAAFKDFNKLLSGEYNIWDFLYYRTPKKK